MSAGWLRAAPGGLAHRLASRLRRGFRDAEGRVADAGVIAVITAIVAVLLFVFAAIAVDVGRWYSEGERVQRTVDAAAMAGAPYLPGDLKKARQVARSLIVENGYTAPVPDSAITIGDRPSRLSVTMSSTIPNAFGTVIGAGFKTVTRTAVADFAASAIMGSDCNVLGNAPKDTSGNSLDAVCSGDTSFWNGIAGPETAKSTGDRYATRSCSSSDSNCAGGRNLDYSGGSGLVGQAYYVYRISAKHDISSMTVQVFDPMFVDVGDHCSEPGKLDATPDGRWALGHAPSVPDAATRYAWGDPTTTPATPGSFCTGDALLDRPADEAQAAAEAAKLNTSFVVLNPTDTLNPMSASPACPAQSFGGFSGDLTKALVPGDPAYNPDLVRAFRMWVPLCTISSPAKNRDYYLLVRTNVPFGASASRMVNPAEDPTTKGDGHNRFGLRVAVAGGSLADVTISALERLPVHANLSAGTSDFLLARVASANAGGRLNIGLFDLGDVVEGGGQSARVQVKDPDGSAPSGCTTSGDVRTGSTADCSVRLQLKPDNGFNGKIQRIEVPIPDDYTCNDADPTSCWYHLHITFGSGLVTDAMTWSASLDGDPVRLVR